MAPEITPPPPPTPETPATPAASPETQAQKIDALHKHVHDQLEKLGKDVEKNQRIQPFADFVSALKGLEKLSPASPILQRIARVIFNAKTNETGKSLSDRIIEQGVEKLSPQVALQLLAAEVTPGQPYPAPVDQANRQVLRASTKINGQFNKLRTNKELINSPFVKKLSGWLDMPPEDIVRDGVKLLQGFFANLFATWTADNPLFRSAVPMLHNLGRQMHWGIAVQEYTDTTGKTDISETTQNTWSSLYDLWIKETRIAKGMKAPPELGPMPSIADASTEEAAAKWKKDFLSRLPKSQDPTKQPSLANVPAPAPTETPEQISKKSIEAYFKDKNNEVTISQSLSSAPSFKTADGKEIKFGKENNVFKMIIGNKTVSLTRDSANATAMKVLNTANSTNLEDIKISLNGETTPMPLKHILAHLALETNKTHTKINIPVDHNGNLDDIQSS